MTWLNRNVWYLAVVAVVFFATPPAETAALPDYCWEVCGESAGCNDPCFPEPESGLITCGDYDGGYENGWCNPYNCASACGDGMCDNTFCGEMTAGATCCTADCGSCPTDPDCVDDPDCDAGEVCTVSGECVQIDDAPSPYGGSCTDDDDCAYPATCYGDPLLGGYCAVPSDICPGAPACTQHNQCGYNQYCSGLGICLSLISGACPTLDPDLLCQL